MAHIQYLNVTKNKVLKQGKNYLYQNSWRSSKTPNGTPNFVNENLNWNIVRFLLATLSNVSSKIDFGLGSDAFYLIAAVLKTNFYH